MLDLVIVGGGPVGLITALYAARAGLSCTVVEPRRGVIDKACGEGLMPGGLATLLDLGIDPIGMPLNGIRYVGGSREAHASFGGVAGRGVRRTELHAALLAAVADAGTPLVHARATHLNQSADAVTVHARAAGTAPTYMTQVTAKFVIAADGLHSHIRSQLGLGLPPTSAVRFGQRRHFAVEPWDDHVQVHWAAHAEAYVTPVAPTLVGVALLTRRRASFDDLLAGFPDLAAHLHDGGSAVLGAGPLRQRTSGRVAGRVLLVGDAAGYVDALTGEGVMLGAAQAKEAISAVIAEDPGSYEAGWRRVTRRHSVTTRTLVTATRFGPVRRTIVPAASALPSVFGAVVRSIGST
ncbi:NAD(P)/FAD-dependent oxidoreductase [Rudaeicoccus suwonensis]|uniref:Flavin-dependent dehydrogenase n=1 Tax=Rudaeicoccus suwonensis TaxID=657409 RepID=A0A561E8E9_9MICO|nr:flavin-dependent dehydrogenase [Rudaeicoccus suwonensis]